MSNNPNWLHVYLTESNRRGLCTRMRCTTCGALEFRNGVLRALEDATGADSRLGMNREAVLGIAAALAEISNDDTSSLRFTDGIMCILMDLWSDMPFLDSELRVLLANTWAGTILEKMIAHDAADRQRNKEHADFNSPTAVHERREEKKRIRRERHEMRLALKKERDKAWKEAHGPSA